jgi:MoaA/NifB/PqqE/SkfB family radical SAM enzyme
MDADCDLMSGPARLDAMRRRAAAEGLPLHGTLALTHRCNFQCIHCYVLPGAKSPETELSTDDWLALAREAADAGCFSILLTGGEPLLRADFAEIYLGIRKLGIHAMLFTNASRVDERVVETLCAAPPRLIEVTVYGATPETYRHVTGRASAYAEAMQGIALLRRAGLSVRLKTVLMRPNRNEFEALRALAADGEPPLRYDAVIQPRFPGDTQIEQLRVPPAEVAELESRAIPELAGQWRAQRARHAAPPPQEDSPLYACAAGAISFYVSAEGLVQPCVSTVRHGIRYERGGLLAAFRAGRQSVQRLRVPAGHECATCGDRVFCGSCPPVAELECGDEAGKCAYACALAHERGDRMASEL